MFQCNPLPRIRFGLFFFYFCKNLLPSSIKSHTSKWKRVETISYFQLPQVNEWLRPLILSHCIAHIRRYFLKRNSLQEEENGNQWIRGIYITYVYLTPLEPIRSLSRQPGKTWSKPRVRKTRNLFNAAVAGFPFWNDWFPALAFHVKWKITILLETSCYPEPTTTFDMGFRKDFWLGLTSVEIHICALPCGALSKKNDTDYERQAS